MRRSAVAVKASGQRGTLQVILYSGSLVGLRMWPLERSSGEGIGSA